MENESHRKLKSDFFLIYFFLYSSDGINLRHDLIHGNIIERSYKSQLIILTALIVALRNIIVELDNGV